MQSKDTWGEGSLLLTRLCAVSRTQCWLYLGDIRASKDPILPKETGPPLAQDRGHAGRKAVAVISGVKLLVSWLAPSGLLWPPPAALPPNAPLQVCARVGGGGGMAGPRPASWLRSESPGIPKASLMAPQCHIRLPPLKGGISDSSFPSPTPSHSRQFWPRLEFTQICGF